MSLLRASEIGGAVGLVSAVLAQIDLRGVDGVLGESGCTVFGAPNFGFVAADVEHPFFNGFLADGFHAGVGRRSVEVRRADSPGGLETHRHLAAFECLLTHVCRIQVLVPFPVQMDVLKNTDRDQ